MLGTKFDLVRDSFIIPFENPNDFLKFSSKTKVKPSSNIIKMLYLLTSIKISILSSLKLYLSFISKLTILLMSSTL